MFVCPGLTGSPVPHQSGSHLTSCTPALYPLISFSLYLSPCCLSVLLDPCMLLSSYISLFYFALPYLGPSLYKNIYSVIFSCLSPCSTIRDTSKNVYQTQNNKIIVSVLGNSFARKAKVEKSMVKIEIHYIIEQQPVGSVVFTILCMRTALIGQSQ